MRDLKREMGTRRASLQKQMLHELEQRIYVANIKVTWRPMRPGLERRSLASTARPFADCSLCKLCEGRCHSDRPLTRAQSPLRQRSHHVSLAMLLACCQKMT